MLRSSLSILTLLALVACGPADIGERSQESEQAATTSNAIEGCSAFDAYTAALGTLAVDCLGTIGPDSFYIDDKGYLRRNFERCVEPSQPTNSKLVRPIAIRTPIVLDPKAPPVAEKNLLRDIDDLLGVQILTKEQQGARECFAGGWAAWLKEFKAANVQVCPVWTKTGTINAPTARIIDAYAKLLPKLPAKEDGTEPPDPKVNSSYSVRFPTTPPQDQKCQTPADCGRLCVGGFKGAWVDGKGETAILDPIYWLITTEYTTTNPFMRAGYYHKMSYFGDDPGMIYGHRNRTGEYCSRFYDGVHYLLYLEEDCAVEGDLSTCVSRCGSLEAAMYAAGVSDAPAP